jgi:hypothetical protein
MLGGWGGTVHFGGRIFHEYISKFNDAEAEIGSGMRTRTRMHELSTRNMRLITNRMAMPRILGEDGRRRRLLYHACLKGGVKFKKDSADCSEMWSPAGRGHSMLRI